jgi:hypothetical protein
MVPKYVVDTTESSMRRMWHTSSTLSSDVHIAYHYKGELSDFEATSRKLDALLYGLSSALGVLREEGDDEDICQGNGDS